MFHITSHGHQRLEEVLVLSDSQVRHLRDGLCLRQIVEVERIIIQIDRQVRDEIKVGAQFWDHLINLIE